MGKGWRVKIQCGTQHRNNDVRAPVRKPVLTGCITEIPGHLCKEIFFRPDEEHSYGTEVGCHTEISAA